MTQTVDKFGEGSMTAKVLIIVASAILLTLGSHKRRLRTSSSLNEHIPSPGLLWYLNTQHNVGCATHSNAGSYAVA
jgi:hypothetical protein